MKLLLNQSVTKRFSVLVHALGIDENDLLDYESPTHLIHFNGERFLGPYEEVD